MTNVVRILLVLLAFTCYASSCSRRTDRRLPTEAPESITSPHIKAGEVRIYSNGEVRRGAIGAGVVIGQSKDRTYILTAYHVAKIKPGGKRFTNKLGVWKNEKATPIDARLERKASNELDAAIISTRSISNRVAKISRTGPFEGEPVFILGSPPETFRTIYKRRVGRPFGKINHRFRYRIKSFQLNGNIIPGFSGGGVFNHKQELVGMCYRTKTKEDMTGVCFSIKILRDLIQPYTR